MLGSKLACVVGLENCFELGAKVLGRVDFPGLKLLPVQEEIEPALSPIRNRFLLAAVVGVLVNWTLFASASSVPAVALLTLWCNSMMMEISSRMFTCESFGRSANESKDSNTTE